VLDWIVLNKTWLFSGIAVAVPIALAGWLLSRRSNTRVQKQRSGKQSVNIQAGEDVNLRDVGKGGNAPE